jgi:hypothetical protein
MKYIFAFVSSQGPIFEVIQRIISEYSSITEEEKNDIMKKRISIKGDLSKFSKVNNTIEKNASESSEDRLDNKADDESFKSYITSKASCLFRLHLFQRERLKEDTLLKA